MHPLEMSLWEASSSNWKTHIFIKIILSTPELIHMCIMRSAQLLLVFFSGSLSDPSLCKLQPQSPWNCLWSSRLSKSFWKSKLCLLFPLPVPSLGMISCHRNDVASFQIIIFKYSEIPFFIIDSTSWSERKWRFAESNC